MEEKKYEYWLHRLPKAGNSTIRELLRRYHTPSEVYEAVKRKSKGALEVLNEDRFPEAAAFTNGYDLNGEYEKMLQKGIRMLTERDTDYPDRLRTIPSPPYGLYVLGQLPPEDVPTVAMIGARDCSEYGIYVARHFARELGLHGIPVISGMARGIDSISQEAALQSGGKTYAVLGCGVDICYPKSSRNLYEQILDQGGVLSTFPPGTEPIKRLFPERNRIVSGLADVVLVVEARQKSGTFITVDMALEQGREVYAIPGRLTDRLSDGCNLLLQQGALIAVSPKDLLRHLEPKQLDFSLENGAWKDSINGKSPKEQQLAVLCSVLDFLPLSVEEIKLRYVKKQKAAITTQELLFLLMELCVEGYAVQVSSSYFVRKNSE